MDTKKIIYASMFAALSIVFQLSPFWPTTWGMRIDFVAVPWIIVLFLFGLDVALVTAVITSLLIAFITPSSWLGASAKLLATLPILLIVGLYLIKGRTLKHNKFQQFLWFFLAISIVVRAVLMVFFNYYFALPIWLHKSIDEVMVAIPWWMIVVPNIIQSIIEFGIAWLVVFKTKIRKLRT